MAALTLGKFASVFFTSTIYIGRGGIFVAIFHKFSLLQSIFSVGGGGVFGSFLFTFLFDGIIHFVNRKLDAKYPNRKLNKKKFTRSSRFIIMAKKNFGVIGIAFLSPLIISIPLGTFLALKFFGGRLKVFLWFSFFCVFWSIVLHFIFAHY